MGGLGSGRKPDPVRLLTGANEPVGRTASPIVLPNYSGVPLHDPTREAFVLKAGDTMTGNLNILPDQANYSLKFMVTENGNPVSKIRFQNTSLGDYEINADDAYLNLSKSVIGFQSGVKINDMDLTISNMTTSGFLKNSTNGLIMGGQSSGFTVQAAQGGRFNPADATSYYFGCSFGGSSGNTTADNARIYMPKAGTITSVYIFTRNGTPGSNETSTIYVRKNNTADTVISSSVKNDQTHEAFSNTALSIAVAQGDYIEIKWTTPTWATNPLSTEVYATIYVEQ